MLRSHTISTAIKRSASDVYIYLAEPRNYPKWAAVEGPSFTRIGPNDWQCETAMGERVVRFCERNRFGILDHAVFKRADAPIVTPMRAIPNGGGCLLSYTFFQRPGTTDEQFVSAIEWITSDFLTLQSLLDR